jgi:excisionase family DNA binding protein
MSSMCALPKMEVKPTDELQFIGFHCENCGLVQEAKETHLFGGGLAGQPGFYCPICTNIVFPAWKHIPTTESLPQQDTYPLSAIARLLGIQRSAVYRWAKQGTIKTIQSGARKHLRVSHTELEHFLSDSGLSFADCEAGLLTLDEVTRLLNLKKYLLVRLPIKIAHFGSQKSSLRKISQRSLDEFLRSCGGCLADLEAGPLLTKAEVRSLLRLSQPTLDRLIRDDTIPLIHLTARTVRISRFFLDSFLQTRGSSLAEAAHGYLNLSEYMQMYALSRTDAYRQIDTGTLPGAFQLLNRTWLIPLTALPQVGKPPP